MNQRTYCPVVFPKELNFCKDVIDDILDSSDNFSWLPEGTTVPNCLK
jgi:hypothetical protein